jgi:uncharacterized protein YjbI with pentapeptide repeats
MLGLQFEYCNPFGLLLSFTDCTLNHSSFFQNKLKKTHFSGTQLQEVDFTETDLTAASFHKCDLKRAIFESSTLIKADFRTATNYTINPQKNRVKKAKFALNGLPGLLEEFNLVIEE